MPTSLKRSASTRPVTRRNGRSSRLTGCTAISDQPGSSSMVQKLLNFNAERAAVRERRAGDLLRHVKAQRRARMAAERQRRAAASPS